MLGENIRPASILKVGQTKRNLTEIGRKLDTHITQKLEVGHALLSPTYLLYWTMANDVLKLIGGKQRELLDDDEIHLHWLGLIEVG